MTIPCAWTARPDDDHLHGHVIRNADGTTEECTLDCGQGLEAHDLRIACAELRPPCGCISEA